MTQRQYFQVKASGTTPDPAVFCPSEGYILNQLSPVNGWNLLCQFQTNSPSTRTFDPTIYGTGYFSWDLGDGTVIMYDKNITHTYATSETKTVKLYGKTGCSVTSIDMLADDIVGNVDLRDDAFKALTSFGFQNNTLMTGVQFPTVVTGVLQNVALSGCGLIGSLDLSMFNKLNTISGATFSFSSCPLLTGITFATTITGKINMILAGGCNLTGNLDLTMFNSLVSSTTFNIYSHPNLTSVTFAPTIITGSMVNLQLQLCNLTGTLDLSMFKTLTDSDWGAYSNPNLTKVLMPSTTIGTMKALRFDRCNLTGVVDLTSISAFGVGTNINYYTNPLMTGILFSPTAVTNTVQFLRLYETGIVGNLDLSMFNKMASTGAYLDMHSNQSMTGITFASSVSGMIADLIIKLTGIAGNLDLSMFNSFSSNGNFVISSNPNMTGVTLASSITGLFTSIDSFSNQPSVFINPLKFSAPTSKSGVTIKLMDNGWTSAQVNEFLVGMNTRSISGYSSRFITINGTNAAPDSTSGGFDGVAAKSALIGKGFSVVTS